MTIVSSAEMDWTFGELVRFCDVCRHRVRSECRPSTYENQMAARRETAHLLSEHLQSHTPEELLDYVHRTHQVSVFPPLTAATVTA